MRDKVTKSSAIVWDEAKMAVVEKANGLTS